MNNKQKEILHQHRHFLARNIVWSDNLINKLLAQGVITESELKDVQGGGHSKSTNYGKNLVTKLTEVIPLRGSGAYEKFCNILLQNGHSFIADFLRDEEKASPDAVDLKPLYKELPHLEKALKPEEKKLVETFLSEKVKETSLKGIWTKEAIAREKDKAIEAKQKQLEDAFEYEVKEKQYKADISALEDKLVECRNDIIELKSQLGFVGSKLRETEDKFKTDFGVQMKYNAANENAMKKLENKIETYEGTLRTLEKKIGEILHMPERNSERDQMKMAEYRFAFLEEDMDRLMDKYRLLQGVEKQYDQLLQERDYILAHLGHHSSSNKPSLLNAYRDFAVKTDEDMLTMKQQIEKHHNLIENQQEKIHHLHKEVEVHTEQKKMKNAGTVWQNAMMGVMRKQLNDVKYENRLKDTRIKHYETEMTKLKTRIAELESQRRDEDLHSQRHYHHHQHSLQTRSPSPRVRIRMEDIGDGTSVSKFIPKGKRGSWLPPLGGEIIEHSNDHAPPILSPTRGKPKASGSKATSLSHNVAVPEGLMTHQLRLEHRAGGVITPPGGRHGGMAHHGYHGLKVTHGKPSKYAHVRS